MKIGIIVHSRTGNTQSVALKLKDKLSAKGHLVDVIQLKMKEEYKPGLKDIQFEGLPDLNSYEGLILGSPVEAFSLCPVMKGYISQVPSFESKKMAGFVTQFFPFPWMGGNGAIVQMKALCKQKNGTMSDTGVINWKNRKREKMITDMVDKLGAIF